MKNIVLVGFMGTGKTSVGLSLAERLDLTFLDMDDIIVEREGRSIPEIFDKDGEEYFRALERAIVRELAGKDGLVVATGGGVVLNRDNVDDFERTGLLVCLSASPEVILARVGLIRTDLCSTAMTRWPRSLIFSINVRLFMIL